MGWGGGGKGKGGKGYSCDVKYGLTTYPVAIGEPQPTYPDLEISEADHTMSARDATLIQLNREIQAFFRKSAYYQPEGADPLVRLAYLAQGTGKEYFPAELISNEGALKNLQRRRETTNAENLKSVLDALRSIEQKDDGGGVGEAKAEDDTAGAREDEAEEDDEDDDEYEFAQADDDEEVEMSANDMGDFD